MIGNTGDSGLATNASIYIPQGGDFDKYGNYYFAVSVGERIRKISPLGIITTVAGNGTAGFSGDSGLATNAQLNGVIGVKVDTFGNLYIVEGTSKRIRKVDFASGIITTIAGNGSSTFNGDSIFAINASIGPRDVCLDKSGNTYIADAINNRVRKVNTNGIITTFAGTGSLGIGGMGGPATLAQIQPTGLYADKSGNIYIADNQPGQTRVCKVDTNGIIVVVAGNPLHSTFNGDNIPATDAYISPVSIAQDKCGNLYIDDVNNNRIRMVDDVGIITTVVGNGIQGYSGDQGNADSAKL